MSKSAAQLLCGPVLVFVVFVVFVKVDSQSAAN